MKEKKEKRKSFINNKKSIVQSIIYIGFEWEVEVRFQSDTPVVSVEINPWVYVSVKGSYLSSPSYSIKHTWYREHHHQNEVSNSRKDWSKVSSTKSCVPSKDDVESNLWHVSVAIDDLGMAKSYLNILFTSPVI